MMILLMKRINDINLNGIFASIQNDIDIIEFEDTAQIKLFWLSYD